MPFGEIRESVENGIAKGPDEQELRDSARDKFPGSSYEPLARYRAAVIDHRCVFRRANPDRAS